jgi:hypothetical protein
MIKLSARVLSLLEFKSTLPNKYLENDVAMDMIRKEIDNMAQEIIKSEKGTRGQVGYGHDSVKYATKSTFPDYLQKVFNNQGTTKKFMTAVKRGKGITWDRIALEAIDRLENGYSNQHNRNTPDKEFIDVVQNPVPF